MHLNLDLETVWTLNDNNIFLQIKPNLKLNVYKYCRVYDESVSSSSLLSSSSLNALFSSGPVSGWADTPPDPWLFLTPPGWWRCRTALRRSRSVPASSLAWWTLAADKPRPPPGSSDTVYRSGSARSTDPAHSHLTAHSSTSLELEDTQTQASALHSVQQCSTAGHHHHHHHHLHEQHQRQRDAANTQVRYKYLKHVVRKELMK